MISKKKKKLLIEFKDYTCEICKHGFEYSELEIHRINRGLDYSLHRNLMVLCKKCHNEIHWGEF